MAAMASGACTTIHLFALEVFITTGLFFFLACKHTCVPPFPLHTPFPPFDPHIMRISRSAVVLVVVVVALVLAVLGVFCVCILIINMQLQVVVSDVPRNNLK